MEKLKKHFGKIAFNYTNADGDNSDRILDLQEINTKKNYLYFIGQTEDGPRTFRTDRITDQTLVICETGEIITIIDYIQRINPNQPETIQPKTPLWKLAYYILAALVIVKIIVEIA